MNTYVRDQFLAIVPTGSLHFVMQAASTVETTINGFLLECNGVNVSRATYSALNTKLSGLSYPFGSGDGSTTMGLPDLQGRMLVAMAASGHVDVNGLGDSDGYTKTTRTPKHNSTDSLSITGAPGVGTLALPNHVHSGGVAFDTTQFVEGATPSSSTSGNTGNPTTLPAITGAPSVGTLAVGGSVGPGGTRPDDTVPYLVAGVWGVAYK